MHIMKPELQTLAHKSLDRDGFFLARSIDHPSDEELLEFACRFSKHEEKLLHWDFGPIMKMKLQKDASNYLFSDEAVPFHWDGAFYKEPRFLLFYCDQTEGFGGETLFCDTEKVASLVNTQALSEVELVYETEKLAHYGGKIRVPLVQKHPFSQKTILRFAERVDSTKNPVSLKIIGSDESLYQKLASLCKENTITHQWQTGDLIIVDNFKFIHGRNALNKNISRSFRRLQIL